MASYTILMDNNKILKATNIINLYQYENLTDKICFIIPYEYGEFDLREFTCSATWSDPTGVAHLDILTYEEELYKEQYIRCYLPVTSEINKYIGNISLHLEFQMNDYDNGVVYVLKTQDITIPILSIHNYYNVVNSESLSFVTQTVSTLNAKIAEINTLATIFDTTKADNVGINTDGDLQLKAKGSFIGDAISVAIPSVVDDDEDDNEGIIDLNRRYQNVEI